ncbi:DUF4339 domain-containing protein [Rariglobus hedericola]|uniref:DUF4339 domain-containing protein n=1 Tax=Rariglobus hedericola TaxID=2597822 RepID=A0A556QR66_9BACT|nr:DUF4339 domain-containing protein [Rariglobus hedericola]TSJ79134.1 DUF4339 domain-containing protein [Rariglobus hedericola]
MATPPRYFMMEDGQRTGPHSLAVLLQKAEMHALTADTLIAPENEPGIMLPLRDFQVLCSELLPERVHYTLGAHAIDRVNTTEIPAALSVQEILSDNLARERAVEGQLLKSARARTNNRRRDYVLLTVAGNAFAALAWVLFPGTPMVVVSLLGFVVIYNVSLAWVLYGVMDRY